MAALRYQPYGGKGAGGQGPRLKTKMCSFFIERGTCTKGEFCNFAHSESELQPDPALEAASWVPGNLDTPLQALPGGPAADGLHGPRLLKTKMCSFFMEQGSCVKGAACNFAHFPEELRNDPFAPIVDTGGVLSGGAASPPATIKPVTAMIAPVAAPGRLMKTKMCSFFVERGSCAKGDSCNFAHFPEEMQDPGMAVPGVLSGGSSGSFAMAMAPQVMVQQTVQGPAQMFKTKMCVFFVEKGQCAKGAECNFAHFPEELQAGLPALQGGPIAVGPIVPPQPMMSFVDARYPHSRAKTKMCSFFVERGSCTKGEYCDFAHYAWELQSSGGCPGDASPMGKNSVNGGDGQVHGGSKHTCPRCGHSWKEF